MIRVLYTDGVCNGDLVRVTDWPNKDRLEGRMVRKLLRNAVQEAVDTCRTGICSFDVLRVEGPEAPFYDLVEFLDKPERLAHGESIMFGMANNLLDRTLLHYGRSPSNNPDLVRGLCCHRVYRSR